MTGINVIAKRGRRSLRRCPDWIGKGAIILPARDDVPVDVWRHVAKAGKINFVWVDQTAQGRFDSEDNTHYLALFIFSQIGHFTFMSIKDDTAEPRIVRIGNMYHATKRAFPDQLTARGRAQFTNFRGVGHDRGYAQI